MKRALVFIDEGSVKVIIGSVMKVIQMKDLTQPHNLSFFDKIFSDSEVFVIDALAPINKVQLVEIIQNYGSHAKAEPRPAEKPEHLPATAPAPQPRLISPPSEETDGSFLKSNHKTTIIIEDLPTGRQLYGQPEYLSILPGGAVNLSMLDPDAVRRSRILQRLLANGTLTPITGTEADRLNDEVAAKQRQDADSHLAPILNTTVDNFISGGGGGSSRERNAIQINLDDNATRRDAADALDDNGGFENMSALLDAAGRAEDADPAAGVVEVEVPQRRLLERPKAAVVGDAAKGIARRHRA